MADEAPEVVSLVPCTIKTMAPEQVDQILRWYAAGHSPLDVMELAESQFNLILEKSEALLIWTEHRTQIAEHARQNVASMRTNPYYEPAFIVGKLNMLLFGLEEMVASAIREGATGPTAKLVDTYLRVIGQMDKYRPAEGAADPGGSQNWEAIVNGMDEVDGSKVRRLLGEINELLAKQPRGES